MAGQFQKELEALLTKYGRGQESETPDHILAQFVRDSIIAFTKASQRIANWNPTNYGDQ